MKEQFQLIVRLELNIRILATPRRSTLPTSAIAASKRRPFSRSSVYSINDAETIQNWASLTPTPPPAPSSAEIYTMV